MPVEALRDLKIVSETSGAMRIVPGNAGPTIDLPRGGTGPRPIQPKLAPRAAATRMDNPIRPENFGAGNLNSVFHYSDYLVDAAIQNEAPYRFSGWFVFTDATGGTFRCTASLISRSILATAGHCAHQGGNGDAGFIRAGTYYPAYRSGESPLFGSAAAIGVIVSSGWYSEGAIDQGYDVALVILGQRAGTTTEIGDYTGWYGFCQGFCLQNVWHNTQIGYPGNYYDGALMTHGEHLEVSDTRDYIYGTGMQGGSSGGPHAANFGDLSDSTPSQGEWPYRNVLFAVTSWGYVDDRLKVQGASTLSGPGERNNFTGMYNAACGFAQSIHGAGSCTQL